MARLAQAQNCSDWYENLKREHGKSFDKLRKDFDRHGTGNSKEKFPLLTWKKTWEISHGNRAAGRHKMMWQE
eukprot:5009406-Amphidinium_carterae.1